MKRVTNLTAKSILLVAGCLLMASPAMAGDIAGPSPEGLYLSVEKSTYHVGARLKFTLSKSGSVQYPTPANLEGSYYQISYRTGNHGNEFYTSQREPCGNSLRKNERHVWYWNQRDNEQQHRAEPGRWRLRFFTPGVSGSPLTVYFTIVE